MKSIITFVSIFGISCLSSYTDLDYDYMTEWGNAMCASQTKSPININTLTAIKDNTICAPQFEWDIDETKQTFRITNNGFTLSMKPIEEYQSEQNETSYIPLSSSNNAMASFPNYFQPSISNHNAYCLDSFHFRWGMDNSVGSEHQLNGYQYPLELQLVHYSCDNQNIGETLEQYQTEQDVLDGMANNEDTRQLAVVSILFDVDESQDNAAFDVMLADDILSNIEAADTSDIVIGLDLNDLIPADIRSAGYYAYEGALTSPPCSDIVRHFVMNTIGKIGTSQIEKFRQLLNKFGDSLAPNFKETQTNDDAVYACVGYLAGNGNDEVIDVVVDGSANQKGYVGWIFLTIFMGTTALLIVCFFGKYCETKTHVPLTADKTDDKSFIERKVYGVITDQITATKDKETADV